MGETKAHGELCALVKDVLSAFGNSLKCRIAKDGRELVVQA